MILLACPVGGDLTAFSERNQPLTTTNYVTISGLGFTSEDLTPSAYVSSGSCQTTSWTSATTVWCKMGPETIALTETTRNRELWAQIAAATSSKAFTFDGNRFTMKTTAQNDCSGVVVTVHVDD